MDGMMSPVRVTDMIDDRPDEGFFRVDRDIYLDPDVFEAELKAIFESDWIFLCHESQVKDPGDYFAAYLGRQPVFVHRQEDGGLKGFLNACSHRGAILTPTAQGNAKTITCRFHGWTYKCSGECIRIKEEEGGYGADFDRSVYDLTEIGAIGSYKGFVFGSLSDDVQPLEDFLGESKFFIDFVADQSAAGLEVLPGSQKYIVGGNWKMSTENAVDGYHTSTVHRIFASTVKQREAREGYEGMMLRNINSPYKFGPTRSSNLLKVKEFQDDEFKIVGYEEGQGTYAGTPVWVLELNDDSGRTFTASPMGNRATREQMWADRDELVGKMATVKFLEYTNSGSLRHPNVKSIRDTEQ